MEEENKDDLEELGEPEDKDTEEDKTSQKDDEELSDADKKKKSEIEQKKHWREKYKSVKDEYDELKAQKAADIKKSESVSKDEAEKKAQEYIDGRIEKLLKQREAIKDEEEKKAIADYEEAMEEALEENPDISEKEVLDITEEFLKDGEKLTPKQAIKILKRGKEPKKEKPKMPSPQRASSETKVQEEEKKPETDFWKVTDKLIKKVRGGQL